MTRLVLALPGVLAAAGREGPLRRGGPTWERMAASGRVVRLDPAAGLGPLAWLGIEGGDYALSQGPLTLAAFGVDPPAGASLAHLSLASLSDEGRVERPREVAEHEARQAIEAARRLETARVHLVAGDAGDHGLVWLDGPVEIEATPLATTLGRDYREALPRGEGESQMRRLVEDGVELLDGLDLNKRRRDAGLAPINLLWPWGFGHRPHVPNLAVAFGAPVPVRTRSIRLIGLARLAGLSPNRPGMLGRGVFPTLPAGHDRSLPARGPYVVHIDGFRDAARAARDDESARVLRDVGEAFLEPVLGPEADDARGIVVATDSAGTSAIALAWGLKVGGAERLPFDERAVEDGRGPLHALPDLVRAVLETEPREARA